MYMQSYMYVYMIYIHERDNYIESPIFINFFFYKGMLGIKYQYCTFPACDCQIEQLPGMDFQVYTDI